MKKLAAPFIYSNTWVALSLSSLLVGICTFYHISHAFKYALFGFCATVSAYQLHRLFRLKIMVDEKSTNPRLTWMNQYPTFQWVWFLISLTIATGISFLIKWNVKALGIVAVNAVIVVLYAFPMKAIGNGIRNTPFLKNVLISCSWILVLVLPFVLEQKTIPFSIMVVLGTLVFCYILPFDVRDLPYDEKNMRTLPQLLGRERAQKIGILLITSLLLLTCEWFGFHWLLIVVLGISFIGYYWPISPKTDLISEFLWELPLFLMGLYFLSIS